MRILFVHPNKKEGSFEKKIECEKCTIRNFRTNHIVLHTSLFSHRSRKPPLFRHPKVKDAVHTEKHVVPDGNRIELKKATERYAKACTGHST